MESADAAGRARSETSFVPHIGDEEGRPAAERATDAAAQSGIAAAAAAATSQSPAPGIFPRVLPLFAKEAVARGVEALSAQTTAYTDLPTPAPVSTEKHALNIIEDTIDRLQGTPSRYPSATVLLPPSGEKYKVELRNGEAIVIGPRVSSDPTVAQQVLQEANKPGSSLARQLDTFVTSAQAPENIRTISPEEQQKAYEIAEKVLTEDSFIKAVWQDTNLQGLQLETCKKRIREHIEATKVISAAGGARILPQPALGSAESPPALGGTALEQIAKVVHRHYMGTPPSPAPAHLPAAPVPAPVPAPAPAPAQPAGRQIFITEDAPFDDPTTQLDPTQRGTLKEGVPAGTPQAQIKKKEDELRRNKQRVRAEVFDTTREVCRDRCYVVGRKKISWKEGDVSQMVQGTRVCATVDVIPSEARGKCTTKFTVVNKDTFDAAKALIDRGLHPAATSFANALHAGGGFLQGAGAQEESLFRCSNLSQSLTALNLTDFVVGKHGHKHYVYKQRVSEALKSPAKGVIVSPHVLVFREGEGEAFDFRKDPFAVDVISCAAYARSEAEFDAPVLRDATGAVVMQAIGTPPNTRQIPVIDEDAFREGMKEKVRNILRAAKKNENDSVVLGAFGCGAFDFQGKTTAMMLQIFPEVFKEEEFQGVFKEVTFAVLDRGGQMGLYSRFQSLEGTMNPSPAPAAS